MSEKERNKAGLHKNISSIFNGVLVPQPENDKKPSGISVPEGNHYAEPKQPVQESQKPESLKPNQTEQILPKAESTQEGEAEPVQEPKAEPVQESEAKPARTPKFMTARESKVVPIQESEAEPVQEPKAESVQESEAKPAHTPKFMTAQESKVVPIQETDTEPAQESEVGPVQEPEDKPAHTPKFMTAQGSKVVPIQETGAEQAQEHEAGPTQKPEAKPAHLPQFLTANKTKLETTRKSKVIPVQQPKADNENIANKRTVVKIVSNGFWGQIKNKLFAPKPGTSTTKQKVMVIMLPVLFILLLIFVFRGGVLGTSANKTEAGDENNASGIASADSNAQIEWKIPETYPATLRDPMQLGPIERVPDQNKSGGLVELTVKSILYSEDMSSAVIGNKIVHEGEKVRGVRIIKINRDNVEFEMNGKIWYQKVQ